MASRSDVMKKGPWSSEEDQKLIAYIRRYGIWNWNHMAAPAGLARSGKSCRLRWMNYLRPNIRHGNFTLEEEEIIIKWQQVVGNKWSLISSKLEGRTDNEVKNYWNTRLKKRFVAEERSVCDAAAGVKSEFEDSIINCWIKEEAAESISGDDTTSDNQMLLVDSETENMIRSCYWEEEELYAPMSIVTKDFGSMFMVSGGDQFISPYDLHHQESFSNLEQFCIDDINLWEN